MEVYILEERIIDIDEIIIISKKEVLKKLSLNDDEIYIVKKSNIKSILDVTLDNSLTGDGVLNIEGETININIKEDTIFSFDLKKFYKIG